MSEAPTPPPAASPAKAGRLSVALLWRQGVSLLHRRSLGWAVLRTWDHLRRGDFSGLRSKLTRLARQQGITPLSYDIWIKEIEAWDEAARLRLTQQLADAPRPLVSVLMPAYNTPPALLDAAIESVRQQVYDNWELCIADDGSTNPETRKRLAAWVQRDRRIKFVVLKGNSGISAATNAAFGLANGAWVALLDHDDLLTPDALAEIVLEIARHPDAQLIYTDEDKLGADGSRYEPYFKPDFSRELFRTQNYFNHLTVHRAQNIRVVGGWRSRFDGSQDYDLNLRIFERVHPASIRHVAKVLYHWRAVEGSTARSGSEKGYAYKAGLNALREHVARAGLDAIVEAAPGTAFYRLHFRLPEPSPLVTLIIPTKDQTAILRRCIDSVIGKTVYPNYEILVVDNGSETAEARRYLAALEELPAIRVRRDTGPFNFSALNNRAVAEARGTIIGLVNDDIEVISPDWLDEMVSWACQPDVGCVGAKLYYADDRVQHAGVVIGLMGVAGHAHRNFQRTDPGYFGRLMALQNFGAVTGACLLVRKQVYDEVGGLDEDNLAVAFNDVDFCLRVRQAGYLNVWTPYAELYHLESASRGPEDNHEKLRRFAGEIEFMRKTWALGEDPYYSPHLTRQREDFSLGPY